MIISVASVMKNLPSPPTTRVEPSRSFSRAQSEHWWMTKVKWDFKTTWQTQPWPITTLVKYSAQTNLYKVFCVVLLLKLLDRLPQPACSRLLSIVRGGGDDQGWSVVVGHDLEENIHKFLSLLWKSKQPWRSFDQSQARLFPALVHQKGYQSQSVLIGHYLEQKIRQIWLKK